MKLFKRRYHLAAIVLISLSLQHCTVVQYKPSSDPYRSRDYNSYPNDETETDVYDDSDEWSFNDENTEQRKNNSFASSPTDNFYAPVSTALSENFGAMRYEQSIRQKARQYGIDHYLMLAIIQAESRGNTMAVSSANCRGLTQLHINTARDYNASLSLDDLHNPEINLEIASQHMARLRTLVHSHFPGADLMTRVELLAAAWNAGWNRVKQSRGVPNIGETQRFTARVAEYYRFIRWGKS